MKKGSNRFIYYTKQIEQLLAESREQKNPAIWLYSNNGRTPFFMLEGLAKIYGKIHNPKKFDKIKKQVKLVEDGLGQIDYYNWLDQAFTDKKEIPFAYKEYIKKQLNQKTVDLNELLITKSWLSADNKRIIKITRKLKEAHWLNPEKEIKAIKKFYKKSILSISKFVIKTNYTFDNIENDVHELRRKIRWLSIYPQALQGVIQYSEKTTKKPDLEKYLTEEIVNSPFNIMPAATENTPLLMLDRNYFLSLSWMIAKLGSLKDEGLLITGLCEAITNNTSYSDEEALSETYSLLGGKQRKMQEILIEAEQVTNKFFNDKILQGLISR